MESSGVPEFWFAGESGRTSHIAIFHICFWSNFERYFLALASFLKGIYTDEQGITFKPIIYFKQNKKALTLLSNVQCFPIFSCRVSSFLPFLGRNLDLFLSNIAPASEKSFSK